MKNTTHNPLVEKPLFEEASASNHTKSELLAELMQDTATLESIGCAWQLYLRLVLIEEGTITGTRMDIADILGISESTLKNWVALLKKANIITHSKKGRQTCITLTEPHMRIAKAPSTITVTKEAIPQELSPELMALKKITEASHELNASWEIRVARK